MAELPLPLQFLTAMDRNLGGLAHEERSIAYLKEENSVLLRKLGGRVRLDDPERRRPGRLGKELGRKALHKIAAIAAPDTILRWCRELVARKYDGSGKRKAGRPRKVSEVVRLLVRMAKENPRWGYTRLRGALPATTSPSAVAGPPPPPASSWFTNSNDPVGSRVFASAFGPLAER